MVGTNYQSLPKILSKLECLLPRIANCIVNYFVRTPITRNNGL